MSRHSRCAPAAAAGFVMVAAACAAKAPPLPAKAVLPPAPTAATASPETARLNQFFHEVHVRTVDRSPHLQAMVGIKKDIDQWDDISEARAREDHELARGDLARLRREFAYEKLDGEGELSYRLFEYRLEREIAGFAWRHHTYPVNQMRGVQSDVPAFLSNFHRVDTVQDAEAYIARLHGLTKLFAQLRENLRLREEKGIVAPRFVFPRVLSDIANILSGAPFTQSGGDSAIFADFRAKVAILEIDEATRARLVDAATTALVVAVKPAYEELAAFLRDQRRRAMSDDGAWKLPDGDRFYRFKLAEHTTTQLSAEQIHRIGLREVDRIHGEMRAIVKQVGFAGSLAEFFAFVRRDPRFYYANDDAGREAFLADARRLLAAVEARLDELFLTKPALPIVVKRVEPYRETSAGLAFYMAPALDGSRPGIFYANLHDMTQIAKYQSEALVYHEGIPGHHMQNAIARGLEHLPMFRRLGRYAAYSEGWGLYAEYIPREMGLYQDPYSDFGRLSMELWRACRLVVDTGLHAKKWNRARAIRYLLDNTPDTEGDAVKSVERYIVTPGQATAYKIGQLEILRLRAKARAELANKFDLRAFHEVVLTHGPMPLTMLAEEIDAWIARQRTSPAGSS